MGNGIKSSAELIKRLKGQEVSHTPHALQTSQRTPEPEPVVGEALGQEEKHGAKETRDNVKEKALIHETQEKAGNREVEEAGGGVILNGSTHQRGTIPLKKALEKFNKISLDGVKDDVEEVFETGEGNEKPYHNSENYFSLNKQLEIKDQTRGEEKDASIKETIEKSSPVEQQKLPKLPQASPKTLETLDQKTTNKKLGGIDNLANQVSYASQSRGEQGETAPQPQETQELTTKDLTAINQEISNLSRVPASLGMDSLKIERDTSYAIAFCNPHIRRLLKHYKDDPFWSSPSREIISLCLLDTSNSFLDPKSILSMVGGMSDSERARVLRMGFGYNQMTSPAEASIAAKTIIYRMKLTRIHNFIREYDSGPKSESDVDRFINNIIYVSKHYGLSMEVENLSNVKFDEIFPESEFYEEGLKIFPSFFAPLNEVLGYGGYLTGQLVTVAGAPARGKTTFMFNEAVNFAIRGKRVLYFALADQDVVDLVLKFLSIFYGYRFLRRLEEEKGREALLEFIQNTYDGLLFPDAYADVGGYHNPLFDLSPSRIHARNPRMFLDEEVKEVISRIDIVVETEVRPHIQDIQATVMSRPHEPDVVIIDYDRSIKARTTEGLYQEGEEIYDGLVAITKPKGGKKKLVIVASQINKGYWQLPDPPLQSLAESSRKQAISDIVITIGKNIEKTGVHEGFISLVKNRRGPTGKFGYFLLPTTNIVPWSPEYINEERKKIRRKKKEVYQEGAGEEE